MFSSNDCYLSYLEPIPVLWLAEPLKSENVKYCKLDDKHYLLLAN